MKRLKTSIPNGGAPLGEFPVLRDLFDTENKDAIEALLSSITDGETEGVILSGCEVSGTAGDFDISEGYVYLDGKVLRYPGGTGFSATTYLQKAADTEESGTFADTVIKAYIDVETAEDAGSARGSGQYVTVTFADGGQTLKDLIGNPVQTEQGETKIKMKVIEIGDWDLDTDMTVTVTHGLTLSSIRSVSVTIRNDADDTYYTFPAGLNNSGDYLEVGGFEIDGTNVKISRTSSPVLDSTDYDSTSYNRGWITITYEA